MNGLVESLMEELNCKVVFTIPLFGGIDVMESVAVMDHHGEYDGSLPDTGPWPEGEEHKQETGCLGKRHVLYL